MPIYPSNPLANTVMQAFEEAVADLSTTPSTPLQYLLFPESTTKTLNSDNIQIDSKTGEITAAPMTVPGSSAHKIKLLGGDSRIISLPESFMSFCISDHPMFNQRMLGQWNSFTNDSQANRVLAEQLVESAKTFLVKQELLKEALVSMMLTGTISYNVEGEDSISISLGRHSDLTYTPSILWDQAGSDIKTDYRNIKALVALRKGQPITDAICSAEAEAAIIDAINDGRLEFDKTQDIAIGNYQGFITNYDERGIRYLGMICGIRHWVVQNTVTLHGGGSVPAVRAKYIELVSRTTTANQARRMYYGHMLTKINDSQITWQRGKYTTWTKVTDDPVALVSYFKTRPLPWSIRPNDTVSVLAAT